MIFKLSKPLKTTMGQTLIELNINLEGLTGDDILGIEQELAADTNVVMASSDFSRAYLVRVAGRACGIAWKELKKLSIKDFSRLLREVGNFLYGSDSNEKEAIPASVESKVEVTPVAKQPEK